MSSDPYTYPGTEVLRNIPDIRDSQRLAAFEAASTAARLIELDEKPISGSFDPTHLRAIHRHIFQDVFDWAGDFRTVNISKGGSPFASAQFIEPALMDLFRSLPARTRLRGLARPEFAARAGHYFSELNAIHPFREGNGRTQREFIRCLALDAGHIIDWRRTSRDRMLAASRASFATAKPTAMVEIIEACLDPGGAQIAKHFSPATNPIPFPVPYALPGECT